MTQSRSDLPAWKALETHAAELLNRHLRDVFAADGAGRFDATGQCVPRGAERRSAAAYCRLRLKLTGTMP